MSGAVDKLAHLHNFCLLKFCTHFHKYLRDEYQNKDKEVKKSMRKDKKKWVDNLAQSAEKAAGGGKIKELFEIKKLYAMREASQ